MPEPLMTADEASKVLQVGLSTVYLLLQRGELACVRIGRSVRIRPLDLDEFIEARARRKNVGGKTTRNSRASLG